MLEPLVTTSAHPHPLYLHTEDQTLVRTSPDAFVNTPLVFIYCDEDVIILSLLIFDNWTIHFVSSFFFPPRGPARADPRHVTRERYLIKVFLQLEEFWCCLISSSIDWCVLSKDFGFLSTPPPNNLTRRENMFLIIQRLVDSFIERTF
ncbi:hypothetical protein BgiBS90_017235 [Biomphalaria glabrata]|nr:hypothetical protein BgiBS90_017235 [Biomphalaria glabrata]